jgi:hypothetical protein
MCRRHHAATKYSKQMPFNKKQTGQQPCDDIVTVRAVITGSDIATALGLTAQSPSPVLSLCRRLVDAGHDPSVPLHAYRGDTIALIIRSIGEAAGLRVGGHGVGFERIPECGAGPSVAPNAPARTGHGAGRKAA